MDKYISVFGCPTTVHSDQGKEFVSEVWQGLMKALQIKCEMGPSYNPHSNIVERAHKTIHALMRTMLLREEAGWASFLPAIQLAYNTKVNQSTGVTPFLAFTGRECRLPLDLIV